MTFAPGIENADIIVRFRRDTRGLRRTQRDIDDLDRRAKRTTKGIGGLGGGMLALGALGGVAGIGIGSAAAALTYMGTTLLNTETNFNRLQATLGLTTEGMQVLRKQAVDLGKSTLFSTSEVAAAQVELAQSGLQTSEILATIPTVLSTAAAGNIGIGEAAAVVTSQLAAFGIEVSDATRVADVLAKTASSSRTTISALGISFRQVGALAGGLGISIEQAAAAIGVLRNQGLQAEQAGTALRGVLNLLVDPQSQTGRELSALGVDTNAVATAVAAGDLTGALAILNDAGLETADVIRAFGTEAGQAATILISASGDVDNLTSTLEGADGSAAEMQATMESGLPGAMARFTSAIDGVFQAMGESGLTDALVTVLELLAQLLGIVGQVAAPIIQIVANGLRPMFLWLKLIAGVLGGILGPLSTLLGGVAKVQGEVYDGVLGGFEGGTQPDVDLRSSDAVLPTSGVVNASTSNRTTVVNLTTNANIEATGADAQEVHDLVVATGKQQYQAAIDAAGVNAR